MTRSLTLAGLLAVTGLAAACSSTPAVVTPPDTFADMNTAFDALETTYGAEAERTTLPASGSVNFSGYIGGDLDDGRQLIGDFDMSADFATNDISASATNLRDDADQAFSGRLDSTNGQIIPGGAPAAPDILTVTLEGDLAADGTHYTTAIALDGAFVGGTGTDVPDAAGGSADGLLDDGGTGLLLFTGDFWAEAQ